MEEMKGGGSYKDLEIYSHSSCNESIEWIEYIRDCYKDFKNNIATNFYTIYKQRGGSWLNTYFVRKESRFS
jgi:hypothetical protein